MHDIEPCFMSFPEVNASQVVVNRDLCVCVRPSKKNSNQCECVTVGGTTLEIDLPMAEVWNQLNGDS